jgi:hypothetical protein
VSATATVILSVYLLIAVALVIALARLAVGQDPRGRGGVLARLHHRVMKAAKRPGSDDHPLDSSP